MRWRSLAAAVALIVGLVACSSSPEERAEQAKVTLEQAQESLCEDLATLAAELRENPGRLPEARLQELAKALRRDAQLYTRAGDPIAADGIRGFVKALEAANRPSNQRELTVLLNEGVRPAQLRALRTFLASLPEIRSARYISKRDALAEIKALYEDDPELMGELSPAPFPASFKVKVKDPSSLERISHLLAGQAGVDQVRVSTGSGPPVASSQQLEQLC